MSIFDGNLELVIIRYLSCGRCGYTRSISPDEMKNFNAGEHFYGSKKCPACSYSGSIGYSAAQSIKKT